MGEQGTILTKVAKQLGIGTRIPPIAEVNKAVNAYLATNVVTDFSKLPLEVRMSFVQETPKAFIKHREVGKTNVPYIDHFYAERCLNFISNWNWGSKRLNSDIQESTVTTKKGKKMKMYDAMVEMEMWIYLNGNKVTRYISSGHNMYENPATTRADALQSAISKANTKFARQLGIGANVIAGEIKAYDRINKYYIDGEEANQKNNKTPTEDDLKKAMKYKDLNKLNKERKITEEIEAEAIEYFKGSRYETAVNNLLKRYHAGAKEIN